MPPRESSRSSPRYPASDLFSFPIPAVHLPPILIGAWRRRIAPPAPDSGHRVSGDWRRVAWPLGPQGGVGIPAAATKGRQGGRSIHGDPADDATH